MRIAVDMDEVLADTLAGELEWLRREYGHSHRIWVLGRYGDN